APRHVRECGDDLLGKMLTPRRRGAEEIEATMTQTAIFQKARVACWLFIATVFYLLLCTSAPLRLCVKAQDVPIVSADLMRQTDADAMRKSWGCVNCHQGVRDMPDLEPVKLGCCGCGGGA